MVWLIIITLLVLGAVIAFWFDFGQITIALIVAAFLTIVAWIYVDWGKNTSKVVAFREPQEKKTEGQGIREGDLKKFATEGFNSGFNASEEKRKKQEQEAVDKRAPKIQQLAGGACKVTFYSPPPSYIRTGCTFSPGEIFYIRTNKEVQNLGFGSRSLTQDGTDNTRLVFPQESMTGKPLGFRNSRSNQRELVFDTGAATFFGGECTIYISKGAGVVEPGEYRPGVKAAHFFE